MDKAQQLFNRLTESEKISLRLATTGTVEYMADTFRSDLPNHTFEERVAALHLVKARCVAEFAEKSQRMGFSGVTWKF